MPAAVVGGTVALGAGALWADHRRRTAREAQRHELARVSGSPED